MPKRPQRSSHEKDWQCNLATSVTCKNRILPVSKLARKQWRHINGWSVDYQVCRTRTPKALTVRVPVKKFAKSYETLCLHKRGTLGVKPTQKDDNTAISTSLLRSHLQVINLMPVPANSQKAKSGTRWLSAVFLWPHLRSKRALTAETRSWYPGKVCPKYDRNTRSSFITRHITPGCSQLCEHGKETWLNEPRQLSRRTHASRDAFMATRFLLVVWMLFPGWSPNTEVSGILNVRLGIPEFLDILSPKTDLFWEAR